MQAPALFLFDDSENFQGVFISPELWEKIEPHVRPHLPSRQADQPEPEPTERLQDWDMLTQYWDFNYPVNYEVECGHCGESTSNWREDEPRKFLMTSAGLGGQVTFHCRACKSRIIKKHFKDKITSETQPHKETKDPKLNAVYHGNRAHFT
ncbi:hypothetical protein [Desulfohalovibrio reitneri]|uniref:hypothetical protein n=1 Tax=Desulfohalovibrio reitneri TaxID=1307759 RepID=UPI00054F1636|nr:hypothetical protein [Desulfohalovibrio reitneri]